MLADWGLPKIFSDVAYHCEERGDSAFPEGTRPWLLVQALAISQYVATICMAADDLRSTLMPRLFLLGSRLETDAETLSATCDQITQSWRECGRAARPRNPRCSIVRGLAKAPSAPRILPAPEVETTLHAEIPTKPVARLAVEDDDASMRSVLRAMLAHEGHEVFVATNGREALELSLECQPHMMITDWMMPEMDGMN